MAPVEKTAIQSDAEARERLQRRLQTPFPAV